MKSKRLKREEALKRLEQRLVYWAKQPSSTESTKAYFQSKIDKARFEQGNLLKYLGVQLI